MSTSSTSSSNPKLIHETDYSIFPKFTFPNNEIHNVTWIRSRGTRRKNARRLDKKVNLDLRFGLMEIFDAGDQEVLFSFSMCSKRVRRQGQRRVDIKSLTSGSIWTIEFPKPETALEWHENLRDSSEWKITDFYERVRHLGNGDFGTLFEAKKTGSHLKGGRSHILDNLTVALKRIDRPDSVQGSDQWKMERSNLMNEIVISSHLQHRRVMRAEDVLMDDDHAYIVLELMEIDLYDNIDKKAHPNTARIFRQVLLGMAYIRENFIIHCDIKPENILLTSTMEGNSGAMDTIARICDFGLSDFVDLRTRQLQREAIYGTDGFEAPEVISQFLYSEASAVWALGVTFYIVLADILPFADKHETMSKDVPKKLLMKYPESIRDLIENMLNKDPDARPTFVECQNTDWLKDPGQPSSSS